MTDLLDVNVWLALIIRNHDNHPRVERYLKQEASEKTAFCQITAHGLLRLATSTHATAGRPLSLIQAWEEYQSLRRLGDVIYVSETAQSEPILENWIKQNVFIPKHWTDAQLAAITRAYDFRFVTFDRDFRRFPGLNVLILEADAADVDEVTS